jgi:ABC-type Fe3+ transport system substrate-binding protein
MKGAPHPNAGRLFVEFLLSEDGVNIMTEREASAVISYREGYKPPESVKQYMIDLSQVKVLGVKDEVEAYKQFKGMREAWRKVFQ